MQLRGSLWILLLCTLNLLGDVRAHLMQPSLVFGESAILILSGSGENIKFPLIEQIDGFSVVSRQSRQSIEFVNGTVTKKIDQFLTFTPDRNVSIPSYTFLVDGKEEKTEPLALIVASQKEATTQEHKQFSFDMNVSNVAPLQQEGIKLTLTFKRNKSENVLDMRFTKPVLDGFWVKEGAKENPYLEGDSIVHVMNYLIYPQKSGTLHLPAAKIDVARQVSSRDLFMNQIQWKSVLSNDITLEVKPLEGTHMLGQFNINATIDKEEISANETANVTLKITGEGNMDDLEAFKLDIPDGVVFSDTPQIKTWIEGDTLKGEFIQKFAINAQKTFDIPPFSIKFFNPKKAQLDSVATKALHVRVKEIPLVQESHKGVAAESSKESVIEQPWHIDLLSYILGALSLIGVVVLGKMIIYFFKRVQENFPKNEKILLQKMLKHKGKDERIDGWISKLEDNLYKGAKHPIPYRKIQQLLEDFM